MEQFEIYTPTPEDWEKVRDISIKMLETDQRAFLDRLEDLQARNDDEWRDLIQERMTNGMSYMNIAKTTDGRWVATAAAYEAPDEPGIVWIVGIYTDPDYRGNGLAERLIKEVIQQIRVDRPKHVIKLEVNTKQTAAFELYKKLGFTTTKTVQSVLGDGQTHDEYEMVYQK